MALTEPDPKITLYGKGFVGSWLCNLYPDLFVAQDRDDLIPKTNNILYGISTVHNYHVFTNPYLDIDTNLSLFLKVLEACRNKYGTGFTFSLISSWFVYGRCHVPAFENYSCGPNGFYSITAYARESLLASYCNTFHIPYRILRLANIVGVGDKKVSARKNALQYLIRELVQGHPVQIYKGKNIRDYIDVRDAAKAIHIILSTNKTLNQIYNIGNGYGQDFGELIYRVARALNAERLVSYKDVPEFHKVVQVSEFYLATGKLKSLGYVPQHSMSETLDWIVENYLNEKAADIRET